MPPGLFEIAWRLKTAATLAKSAFADCPAPNLPRGRFHNCSQQLPVAGRHLPDLETALSAAVRNMPRQEALLRLGSPFVPTGAQAELPFAGHGISHLV